MGTHFETILSLFGGRRRSISSSLSKRRMTKKAEMDVEESKDSIEEFTEEIEALEEEKAEAIAEIKQKWAEIAVDVSLIPVTPYKKDISVTLFGVAWFPYHLVQAGDRVTELAAFSPE
jgi:hypothetical protein